MQKALDSILRHYLRQETLVSRENGEVDEELLQSLHKCLEEKGVLKQVHAFLRQRLVAVLQGTWPQLFDHFRSDQSFNRTVLKLVEDFLCSHNLLFTHSILSTELGDAYSPKVSFGKFPCTDAERFLESLGIPVDSALSKQILDSYAKIGSSSLLECMLLHSSLGHSVLNEKKEGDPGLVTAIPTNFPTIDERLRQVDEKYRQSEKKGSNLNRAGALSVDQRFRHLALDLERDKQIQLQIAIDKFKSEEISRIREELETEQKFELLRREKELLANYEEKVNHMKNNLEREKELWNAEKLQKEREIFERREELLLAIQSVRKTETDGKVVSEFATQTSKSNTPEKLLDSQSRIKEQQEQEKYVADPSDFRLVKTSKEREMEREYLLKEARLRTVIDRLEQENEKLKAKSTTRNYRKSITSTQDPNKGQEPPKTNGRLESNGKGKERNRQIVSSGLKSENSDRSKATGERRRKEIPISTMRMPDTDTVAFLQYQLECQSEEIEKLRNVVQSKPGGDTEFLPRKNFTFNNANASLKPTQSSTKDPHKLPNGSDTDMDDFLREAKKRISDIEQEANLVEETLVRLHSDNNLGNFPPQHTRQRKLEPKSNPVVPPPPIVQSSLLDRIMSIPKLDSIPKYLQPGVRKVGKIPSIASMESRLISYSTQVKPSSEKLKSPSTSVKTGHILPEVDKKKNRIPTSGTERKTLVLDENMSEQSSSLSASIKTSPRAEVSKEVRAQFVSNLVRIQDREAEIKAHSLSSSPSSERSLKTQKNNKNEVRTPFECDDDGVDGVVESKSESLNERASKSGALVKDKVEKEDDPIPARNHSGSGDMSLKSFSESMLKSPEKASKPLRPYQDAPSTSSYPGERRISTDLKGNPVKEGDFPTQSEEVEPSNFLSPLTAPVVPLTIDDLGQLETSNDMVIPDNIFWQM